MTSPYGTPPGSRRASSWSGGSLVSLALGALAIGIPFVCLVVGGLANFSPSGNNNEQPNVLGQFIPFVVGAVSGLAAVVVALIGASRGKAVAKGVTVFTVVIGLAVCGIFTVVATSVAQGFPRPEAAHTPAAPATSPPCGADAPLIDDSGVEKYLPCDAELAEAHLLEAAIEPALPTANVDVAAVDAFARDATLADGKSAATYSMSYFDDFQQSIIAIWRPTALTCLIATWNSVDWVTEIDSMNSDGGCVT